MKSNKFIQFYDEKQKPILSSEGIIDYDKRTVQIGAIIKQVAAKIPKDAKFWALKKTLLNTTQQLTPLIVIYNDDN